MKAPQAQAAGTTISEHPDAGEQQVEVADNRTAFGHDPPVAISRQVPDPATEPS